MRIAALVLSITLTGEAIESRPPTNPPGECRPEQDHARCLRDDGSTWDCFAIGTGYLCIQVQAAA